MSRLVREVGYFFDGDKTEVYGKSLVAFWKMLHVEYCFKIRDSTIVKDAEKMGINTILVESWLEKKSIEVFSNIPITNENGEIFLYKKEDIDGLFCFKVYSQTLYLLFPQMNTRKKDFRYFVNTLKKQGWQMSPVFENTLLNEGVFLAGWRDKTKRIPYTFMKKLNIRMK